jgi:tRNA wybutosine-synthesizing protein 1
MSCSGEYTSHNSDNNLIQIDSNARSKLLNAKYGVYNHSAVELCHWTKKSFAHEGDCYKRKFYGISTHRCMEMTPTALNCENRCVYCWRPTEFYDTLMMPENLVDEPDAIVENLLQERRRLLTGFYGHKKYDKGKLDESLFPQHYAISLSGEPTMYPKLPALIRYLKKLPTTKSIFLVTNGQEPQMLDRLAEEKSLPTQLYLSTNATNRFSFAKINRPRHPDAWKRWLTSLEFLSRCETRTVIRITLVRSHNFNYETIGQFCGLIPIANPHFIEIKSYMHVGMSTQRLERQNMLEMEEVREFSEQLCEKLPGFKVMDESEISRIVVLQNTDRHTNRFISSYLHQGCTA